MYLTEIKKVGWNIKDKKYTTLTSDLFWDKTRVWKLDLHLYLINFKTKLNWNKRNKPDEYEIYKIGH